ncbi:hypothetical protein RB195_016054 [Necator americanus]|uniref:ZP domain-containing protein n=1 Tax=Necator americanus TaxID=51031 RepID=A0ABR1E979_NECAM
MILWHSNARPPKIRKKINEEVIQLTPNNLNQAKFLKFQRIPLRRLPTRQERRKSTGAPILICGEGTMGIVVDYPFNGRIYASHREKDHECTQYVTMVYHRWSCPSSEFAFKVYRCYVHNGFKQSYLIINDNGCSLDESILPHPTYDMVNGVVYTPSKAFRFTKSRRVHFNCMLSVCHKNDADCVKDIPPRCPRSLRKRELPGDFSVEERLKNVHALMEVKNITSDEQYEEEEFVGDEKTTTPEASTNTRPLFIEDGPYALPHSCMPSNYLHWIYALLITNILSILVAVVACSTLLRRRFSFDVVALRHKYHFNM